MSEARPAHEEILDRIEQARAAESLARDARLRAEAELVRARLTELTEQHPSVQSFGIEVHWEYDDEGSYYWQVGWSVAADPPLGEYVSPRGHSYPLEERVADQLHGSVAPEVVAALFGVELEDGLSVARTTEELGLRRPDEYVYDETCPCPSCRWWRGR